MAVVVVIRKQMETSVVSLCSFRTAFLWCICFFHSLLEGTELNRMEHISRSFSGLFLFIFLPLFTLHPIPRLILSYEFIMFLPFFSFDIFVLFLHFICFTTFSLHRCIGDISFSTVFWLFILPILYISYFTSSFRLIQKLNSIAYFI